MTALRQQGWRFLVLGGSNTVVTFVLLAVLAHFIDHALAYTIAFAAGLAYTTALTGRFVFSAADRGPRLPRLLPGTLGVTSLACWSSVLSMGMATTPRLPSPWLWWS